MKTLINLFAGMLFLINTSFADELSYKLNLTNINFTSEKSVEFDIYLINTSEKQELRYAAGQYFLHFNPNIAKSGSLKLSVVKSELPESMRPGKMDVFGNQLRISMNLPGSDVEGYPSIPNNDKGILIYRMKLETSDGRFSSKDLDLKWSEDTDKQRSSIAAFADGKLVELKSTGSNVAERVNPANEQVQDKTELPKEFALSQNYPNPFNPSTKISYDLPVSNFVTLIIYDITGREVAKLVNEHMNAGRYDVTFNGANFASGMYFYKITAGSFSSVKRMILIK